MHRYASQLLKTAEELRLRGSDGVFLRFARVYEEGDIFVKRTGAQATIRNGRSLR